MRVSARDAWGMHLARVSGYLSWPRVTELSGDEGNGDRIRREEGVQQPRPMLEHPGHELLRVRFTMCLPVLEITQYVLVPPEHQG
jgi:hypothetical protein